MTKEYIVTEEKLFIDGSFRCPKCDVLISPDDDTQETYTIIDGDVNEKYFELILKCKKCGSIIKLRWRNEE